MFAKKEMNSYFFKTKGFYIFWIPVAVPYKEIYRRAQDAGLKPTQNAGPILEKGATFGFGWIALEVEKPSGPREDVVQIKGPFEMLEHKGPYKTIGASYKIIKKERPKAQEHFNLYLDDPEKVKPEDCRTEILFR